MAQLIEDYALIGDGETAALVRCDGSIDWLCLPQFDSDACFASLLGTAEHGCWKIAPLESARVERRYQPDTLVLETDFVTNGGAVRLTDFMPMRNGSPMLVRMAKGLRGKVMLRSDLRLRFDYGSLSPWIEVHGCCAIGRIGPDLVVLYAPEDITEKDGTLLNQFELGEGEEVSFSLGYGPSIRGAPDPIDTKSALADTQGYWRKWIGRFEKRVDWPEAMRRSLVTLHAMTYRPSGAIVAAPTTSLPEKPGGEMNWDYRFAWVRDASFTLSALLEAVASSR